ncbi:MAG: gas vesicle protein [Myxococcota bacterium]
MRADLEPNYRRASGLVDVLDRVLDKGLVVAGDIRVSLAEVELLTIRIRLIVCSIDKAEQIGLAWWRQDAYFSGKTDPVALENAELRKQLQVLEQKLAALEGAVPNRKFKKLPAGKPVRSKQGAGHGR